MNFILRFFNRKSLRIAELENEIELLEIAAESHARIVGGHRASYTRICRQFRELDDKYEASEKEVARLGLLLLEHGIFEPPTEAECAVDIVITDDTET